MGDPFTQQSYPPRGPIAGPFVDLVPVTKDDDNDLGYVANAIRVTGGGDVVVTTVKGTVRTFTLPDFGIEIVGIVKVHATGTTATGIAAYVSD